MHFLNMGNSIDREDYRRGYCLFAFDLAPDLSANTLELGKTRQCEDRGAIWGGSITNCIVYTEYNYVLEIDAARQVMVEFTR